MGKKLKLAVNTGGGDAPGLNAVIRAVTLSAIHKGHEVYGIRKGYLGLQDTGQLIRLDASAVRGITHLGGSILGANNRGNPFALPVREDGEIRYIDASEQIIQNFRSFGFDGLIAIGGDGSLKIAHELQKKGIPIIGVPKTIDNDLWGTYVTFGYDTAVATATDAISKLHSTAESHERVMVIELMGRYCGWIALEAGLAGTADVILIPEIPFDIEKVCEKIRQREREGRHFAIVVCAEGAKPVGGDVSILEPEEPGRMARLGGIAHKVAIAIEERTGKETRDLVLGHLQRGGTPTAFDRVLSLRFGAEAVRMAERGQWGEVVVFDPPAVTHIPLEAAIATLKHVPLDSDLITTARDLGISFGD
ncbi:MAG: ATP-dependent 6-phosphofructokinase [Deltaproteobacteria bacterium]|nr:MAG: ATP-dependent 6-phosphofructokinase [Deltaproteobacteria bacterium]